LSVTPSPGPELLAEALIHPSALASLGLGPDDRVSFGLACASEAGVQGSNVITQGCYRRGS